MAVRRGLRSCHGLGRKPSQLDRESRLGGGGTEGAPGVVVELDMSYTENVGRLAFSRKELEFARIRKKIQHTIENA